MKKNTMMRIASVLLIAVLITTCAISGTFAKYTSTATATDTASIAKWAFTVGGESITAGGTLSINLFETAKVYDTEGGAATDDTDVKNGDTNPIIAPGTWGYFDFVLANASDVTATCTVALTQQKINADGLNIKFAKSTGETLPTDVEWKDDIAQVTVAPEEIAAGDDASIRIFWKWEYSDDASETALGIAAANGTDVSIKVNATITATQKD